MRTGYGNSPHYSKTAAGRAGRSRTGGSRFRGTSGSASPPSWTGWATQSSGSGAERGPPVLPLYHDPHFIFRFTEDRIIPRFHLETVEAGRRIDVYRIDAVTQERMGLLATAAVGEGGWV